MGIVPHHNPQKMKKTGSNQKHLSSPSTNGSRKKLSNKKYCTIEIQVRLSSLIIKCNATYDVIPNYITTTPYPSNENNNNDNASSLVEPLITLETITSENISLQAVRICDANSSDDDVSGILSDGSSGRGGVILREKKTNVTGKRILSIKPAKYAKVAVW